MVKTGAGTYKKWSVALIIIGCIGLLDLATRSIILKQYGVDFGYPSLGIFYLSKYLFGTKIASICAVIVATVAGFSPLLLVSAWALNRKAKVIENPIEENLKKYKVAKIVAWIVGAVTASLVLFGMGYVIYASFFHTRSTQTSVANNIGSADIARYLSGVGMIRCWKDPGNGLPQIAGTEASGSLWKFGGGHAVLTNKHAVLNNANLCLFITEESLPLKLVPSYKSETVENVDAIAMQVVSYEEAPSSESVILGLNYNISSVPKCPQKMPLGQPVKVIGYPAFSKIDGPGILHDQSPRTVTEGVISAHESNIYRAKTPDYFISAKIDSGSSGGIALSIDQDKLCLLGIPTWLNVGEYETQGIVQNIHNVLSN